MKIVVVGAAGDVGQGVVAAALERGWTVAACGRDATRLDRLAERFGAPGTLVPIAGDIGDETGAARLLERVNGAIGPIDGVVVSVNAAATAPRPLLDWTAAELSALVTANLVTHFVAARAFIPALRPNGVYLAIGGGTADFIIRGAAQLSICQAAQRMMVRGIARERRDTGPHVRELLVVSMVNGEKKRSAAQPDWLNDIDVGRHAAAILADPQLFPGPIVSLSRGDPIGLPREDAREDKAP